MTPQTDDTNAWEALRLRLKARAALERGWQAKMARDLGLSIGQLRDWISGRREPSYSNGKRLEQYLGTDATPIPLPPLYPEVHARGYTRVQVSG